MSGDQRLDEWVEARLARLETPYSKEEEIMMDPMKILARLQVREQARRKTRSRLLGAGVFGALACGALATVITVESRPPVKAPLPPPVSAPRATFPTPRVERSGLIAKKEEAPKRRVQADVNAHADSPPQNFKEIGSPSASVTLEIYIDLECPPCAVLYEETLPALLTEYVETGRVKMLYRDFPLPLHKYARTAARYANAAGMIGKYDVVTKQIMKTQHVWHETGDLEPQVEAVLSAEDLRRLHAVLNTSAEPDESIERDRAAGAADRIEQTPSIVLVANGRRQKVAGVISIQVLKGYLDELLK